MRVSLAMLMLAALVLTLTSLSAVAAADQPAPVQNAVARLGRLLDITADQIQVISAEAVEWPDTSLGCPRPGRMYLQVITPGFRVVLAAQGKRFEYHTDMRTNAVLASIDGRPVGGAATAPAGGATTTPAVTPRVEPVLPASATGCRADLAARVHVAEADIKVVQSEAVEFPDASLGLPRPGEMYAQVITPGQIVVLVAKNAAHLYAVSANGFRYGGPLGARHCSALYIEPIANEANMNGDLVQVSLAGTNPTPVLKLVDNFRPQLDSSIMAMRRTSRSGYDLLYLAPGANTPAKIASGLYFMDAVVNVESKRWATLTRPGLGSGWKVRWGALPADAKGVDVSALLGDKSIVDVPEGAKPQRLYWHTDNPVIMCEGTVQPVFFELVLGGEKPQWRQMGGFFFPPTEETMLNKSESLVVETTTEDGKPVTHVATRWFTGDETFRVDIPDFTVQEFSLAGRFVFLYGQRGEQHLALTVSIQTGEVLTTVAQTNRPVRLWLAPVQGWIWSHLKGEE